MNHSVLPGAEFRRIARTVGWGTDPAGPGDDAAVLPDGKVLCCDALVEGVHFRFDWSSPADVGWKVVIANVADVFAMGAFPRQAVWSVGLGANWTESVWNGLVRGAREACDVHDLILVGGDTVRCPGAGFVSLAMTGELEGRNPWPRSGVQVGDNLWLSGEPGISAAGLDLLRAGRSPRGSAALCVARHRRPDLAPGLPRSVADLGVHAAIDLSDGLSTSLHLLAHASRIGIEVIAQALVVGAALRGASRLLNLDARPWQLHGGEDHHLLIALPEEAAPPSPWTLVGHAVARPGVRLLERGRKAALPARGWVHA